MKFPPIAYSSAEGVISPNWQLIHAATTETGVFADMNRTLPSHIAAWQPAPWKEYSSLLLLQFIAHGPNEVNPSSVKPSTQNSESGSAQPAPLARELGNAVDRRYCIGRPASSTQLKVFEVPSRMFASRLFGRLL